MRRAEWIRTAIGLGSNLQDPERQVLRAIEAVRRIPHCSLVVASPLYRSLAVGPDGQPASQPDFCNAVVLVDTQLSPGELLSSLQGIEAQQGRQRHQRWAARSLDLDLLLYGQLKLQQSELTVPHPRMTSRNFVMHPLRDIAPDMVVPGVGVAQDIAAQLDMRGLTLWRH